MWKRYRRSLYWLLLFGSLLLGKLVQDTEGFLDLRAQTLRRIEQAQELGIVHLQQHTGDFPSKVRLRSITRCVKGWIRQRTRRHLRGNAHVKDFTEHLFLFHWRGIRERGRVEGRDVRGMANRWGGSGGTTIPLFDKDSTLQRGRQRCRIHRFMHAVGYSDSKTPHILPAP